MLVAAVARIDIMLGNTFHFHILFEHVRTDVDADEVLFWYRYRNSGTVFEQVSQMSNNTNPRCNNIILWYLINSNSCKINFHLPCLWHCLICP